MNRLDISRLDGGIPKTLPGEDHISGLLVYTDEIPWSFNSPGTSIQKIGTLQAAQELDITPDSESLFLRMLYFHLRQIFAHNPAIELYLGIYAAPSDGTYPGFEEVMLMQQYAGGRIRQIGIWTPICDFDPDAIDSLSVWAEACDWDQRAPLSILYAPQVSNILELPDNLRMDGNEAVSVLIGQDGGTTAQALVNDTKNTKGYCLGCIGTALGILSRAKVHQSIAWVKEFPTSISLPAFADGTLYRDVDPSLIHSIDEAGYIFPVTIPGQAGSYFNDSHTMGDPQGDYNTIEAVRTMNKAVRGIRTYLTPCLGGNIYIDPESGKMQAHSVSHLETTANRALEDMEKAGELSGYKVEIDPEQDVLSTSTVEVVIKQVPVGVMRRINVKIGFTKQV